MPLPGLQEWIHKLEEGEGVRLVKLGALLLALAALATFYNLREFRNFSTPEAMDAAQLARNIAEGKGFTTQFIRPFSLYLVQSHRPDANSLIKEGHPDLANPPLYPVMLAGLMKVLPFDYAIPQGGQFSRYQPELLIALLNQFWFLLAVWLTFQLAKRLFDPSVAWLAAGVLACTDLFWRFSVSGLPTIFLVDVYLGVVWCLIRLEQGSHEEGHSPRWFMTWAAACGVLVGLGGLTRYAFGWLILPVTLFLAVFGGQRRAVLLPAALLAFGIVLAPWLARNYQASGTLFGTSGYAVCQDTAKIVGTSLERSIRPEAAQLSSISLDDYGRKLLVNSRQVLDNHLLKLGGTWFSAFFLVGLMVPFRSLTLSRLRVFLLFCLFSLAVVQALGQTHLGRGSPEINSENLLVLVVPVVFIYSAAMFFLLLDQLDLPWPRARQWLTGLVGLLACIPLVYTLLPPRQNPIAYPPYYPWLIQRTAGFMKPNELMMSDIPWAIAWYGRCQCIWLTLQLEPDFFIINDYQKPVQGLLLTQATLDAPFESQLVKGEYRPWGRFIMESMAKGKVPSGFPLKELWSYALPEHMFLTDWERWKGPSK